MPLKITKRIAASLEKPYFCRFWGQRRKVKPVLIRGHLGDGMKLIAITPLNTRPNYYLLRVDSSVDFDSEEWMDTLDDVYGTIEEEVGRGGYIGKDDSPTGRAHYAEWPAFNCDSGISWASATGDYSEAKQRRKTS